MITNAREKEQRFECFEFWQKTGLFKKTCSVYKSHEKKKIPNPCIVHAFFLDMEFLIPVCKMAYSTG